jgi:hypothetical protein
METTLQTTFFLAGLWGPALMAVGLGLLISRPYYVKIYRDLEKQTLAMLVFGLAGLTAAIAQIQVHNEWTILPQIVVSFLGWALLVKSLFFLIFPRFVDRSGDLYLRMNILPIAGIVALVIGAYLSWVTYIVNA